MATPVGNPTGILNWVQDRQTDIEECLVNIKKFVEGDITIPIEQVKRDLEIYKQNPLPKHEISKWIKKQFLENRLTRLYQSGTENCDLIQAVQVTFLQKKLERTLSFVKGALQTVSYDADEKVEQQAVQVTMLATELYDSLPPPTAQRLQELGVMIREQNSTENQTVPKLVTKLSSLPYILCREHSSITHAHETTTTTTTTTTSTSTPRLTHRRNPSDLKPDAEIKASTILLQDILFEFGRDFLDILIKLISTLDKHPDAKKAFISYCQPKLENLTIPENDTELLTLYELLKDESLSFEQRLVNFLEELKLKLQDSWVFPVKLSLLLSPLYELTPGILNKKTKNIFLNFLRGFYNFLEKYQDASGRYANETEIIDSLNRNFQRLYKRELIPVNRNPLVISQNTQGLIKMFLNLVISDETQEKALLTTFLPVFFEKLLDDFTHPYNTLKFCKRLFLIVDKFSPQSVQSSTSEDFKHDAKFNAISETLFFEIMLKIFQISLKMGFFQKTFSGFAFHIVKPFFGDVARNYSKFFELLLNKILTTKTILPYIQFSTKLLFDQNGEAIEASSDIKDCTRLSLEDKDRSIKEAKDEFMSLNLSECLNITNKDITNKLPEAHRLMKNIFSNPYYTHFILAYMMAEISLGKHKDY